MFLFVFQAVTKTAVRADSEKKLHELDKVRKPMKEAHKVFEEHLREGVKESEHSCEDLLKSSLYPVCTYMNNNYFKTIDVAL